MNAHMPGFLAAERAWENKEAYPEPDQCADLECGTCAECLAADAEDEKERYAEQLRDENRWGR